MKKTMLVDLDYVICSPVFLPIVNEFFDTNYEEDDFNNTFGYCVGRLYSRRESLRFGSWYLLSDSSTVPNRSQRMLCQSEEPLFEWRLLRGM